MHRDISRIFQWQVVKMARFLSASLATVFLLGSRIFLKCDSSISRHRRCLASPLLPGPYLFFIFRFSKSFAIRQMISGIRTTICQISIALVIRRNLFPEVGFPRWLAIGQYFLRFGSQFLFWPIRHTLR